MEKYIFVLLAIASIASALMVVFSKKAVHSVLFLILTFFTIAGHYVLLNAQFLAIVNIIVYAGAIMVLFLFVVMMLNSNLSTEVDKNVYTKLIAVIIGGSLLVSSVTLFKGVNIDNTLSEVNDIGLVSNLGKVLFNKYVLPFELTSILFLSAMAGSIVLTKFEK